MRKLFLAIAFAIAGGVLGGCAETSMVQANETPGPALQSAYCIQHPNEPRCLNP